MLRKLIESLAVWLVVAVVLWLVAMALLSVNTELTQSIGSFLDRTNVVIGFLAGVYHFFWGFALTNRQ